jgi:hypothetical protein
MNESGNLSDDLDEFEYSQGDEKFSRQHKNQTTFSNKPWDEAHEVSQDLSVAESFDARDKVWLNQNSFELSFMRYIASFLVRSVICTMINTMRP